MQRSYVRHGGSRTPLYAVWKQMRRRCLDENHSHYQSYGGRGIRICDEWANSFVVFREWAIQNCYHRGLSIDRRCNSGNYCPNNCRWTTQRVQMNNNRRNHRLTAFGETKTIAEWSRDPRCVVGTKTFYNRIGQYKWPPEKALTEPAKVRKK